MAALSILALKDPSLLKQACLIGDKWCAADDSATFVVTNPANGEVLATVPKMGANETELAIEAAQAAYPAWRALTAKARSIVLRRWFELIMQNQDDLGIILTA